MGGTVSADPDHLQAYADGGAALVSRLQDRVRALEGTAAALRTEAAGMPWPGALVESIRTYAAAVHQTDMWVGAVAAAFRLADRGTASVDARSIGQFVDAARCAADNDVDGIATMLQGIVGGRPDEVDPHLVAAFLEPLTAGQLRRLAGEHPGLVGPVNGFPPSVRFAANARLIALELARTTDADRRRTLRSFLADDPTTNMPRQILSFDPTGGGRIAQVYGDLGSAQDVAFFVPGMGSDLTNFDDRTAPRAANLFLRAAQYTPGRRVATVAWLGYDAPARPPSLDVLSADHARRGGELLANAVAGLGLADDVSITLIGHSYGTAVIGCALQAGVRADNVLAMGSPGMLVGGAADFGRPDIDYFTMAAPGDFVTRLEGFGGNPDETDSGFTRLDSGGSGHSRYLEDGSLSQRNALAVITNDDRGLDRRGRNMVETAFGPIDIARRWAKGPHTWIDRAQRSVAIPAVDDSIDRGIDVVQSAVDVPRRIADAGIEIVEDGTNVVTSTARWAWPG